MHRAKLSTALAGVLLLAGCVHADEQLPPQQQPRSGPVTVGEAAAGLGARYVTGNVLHGFGDEPVELEAPVNTTLIGTLAPAAVLAPDDSMLAYNAWRGRSPVVRLRQLETGEDGILDEGAHSPAWGADGRLAYFKALEPDLGAPRRYLGHVVVRDAPRATPSRWTSEAGRYVVAAWAGERLLAYRLTSSWPELLVLEEGRPPRVLAQDAALVAVAADGRRAFVSTYGAAPVLVRVLDVAAGTELARRAVRRLQWLTENGSWAGDRVVATSSGGLAVFRVASRSIVLEQVLGFAAAGFPLGLFEPRLAAGGRRVVGWAERESLPRQAVPDAAVLDCDRITRTCRQGRPVSTAVGVRLVYDPSRPLARGAAAP